jgi:DNA modification methylase
VSELVQRSIEHIEITQLKPALRNARMHSKRQIKKLAGLMRRYGFTAPLLVDDDNCILAGHGRLEAAKEIGLVQVPCLRLKNMSAADKRAYLIADNKIALDASWDHGILAIEFQTLEEEKFDLTATGFEQPEVDAILFEAAQASPEPVGPDDIHPEPQAQVVTREGDLWDLGRHKLRCGDAKDQAVVEQLMGGRKADLLFTDPPYNIRIQGHVSGLGRTRHREFAEASGEMSSDQFVEFLRQTLLNAASYCRDGAIAYVCMDWRHLGEVLRVGHLVFNELKNICVWNKTNGGMGTFYRSQHEHVLVFKVGTASHTNTFGLGDKGRYRTNVWTYAGVNTFKSDRMAEISWHPTVKPVALVSDAIRDVSNRGELVLDVFGGSGTTLIAAEKTGRCARLLELDPIYCDVIIRRWQELTGKEAQLLETGESFESVQARRQGEPKGKTRWGQ